MKQYSIEHLVTRPNPRVWVVLLGWLASDWIAGEETTVYTDEYYPLWSPVTREEFPY
jgi:hypothetical protein